ncbi:MAG: hypothetical protein KQJ78_18355 [Deltaproteobacteria bacterium]|nr:hypothetical protein [Deltaproteobacteria bacterium]
MNDFVLRILMTVLPGMLDKLTPAIKDLLEGFLRDIYQKALETPNPLDDFAVKLVGSLIGLDVTQPKVVKTA